MWIKGPSKRPLAELPPSPWAWDHHDDSFSVVFDWDSRCHQTSAATTTVLCATQITHIPSLYHPDDGWSMNGMCDFPITFYCVWVYLVRVCGLSLVHLSHFLFSWAQIGERERETLTTTRTHLPSLLQGLILLCNVAPVRMKKKKGTSSCIDDASSSSFFIESFCHFLP